VMCCSGSARSGNKTLTTGFAAACRSDASLIGLWSKLELDVGEGERDAMLSRMLLSHDTRSIPLYTVDERDMEIMFVARKCCPGVRMMVSRVARRSQSNMLVMKGASNNVDDLLRVASSAVGSAVLGGSTKSFLSSSLSSPALGSVEKDKEQKEKEKEKRKKTEISTLLVARRQHVSSVFEVVSQSASEKTTVRVVESMSFGGAGKEKENDGVGLRRAVLRGVLHGGGSAYALRVMEEVGESFWSILGSGVFAEIVQFDDLRSKRAVVTKALVSGLDKYLWSRKPTEGLPPQLRALRQCERSLVAAAEMATAEMATAEMATAVGVPPLIHSASSIVLSRMPASTRKLFDEKKQEVGGEEVQMFSKLDDHLPMWLEDEGGQWGVTIPLDRVMTKMPYLQCEMSGAIMESGQMVTVFQCGHVVAQSSVASSYGMCPMCAILTKS